MPLDVKVAYLSLCVVLLIVAVVSATVVRCVRDRGVKSALRTVVLTSALVIPPMSHVYHIVFGQGSMREGAPWWDSYEITVFAEIVLLRGVTTALLREWSSRVLSGFGLVLAVMLLLRCCHVEYNWIALVTDFALLAVAGGLGLHRAIHGSIQDSILQRVELPTALTGVRRSSGVSDQTAEETVKV